MPARRKTVRTDTSFFNKDLFIFVLIMAIVAIVTYVLTYNAITAKFNQQIGAADYSNYQLPSTAK